MPDKREIRHNIKQLQRVKTWQLFVLLLLVGFVTATFLRLNNIEMIQRRTAVMDADKSGDTLAIKNRLIDLQRHVTAHMNADMGTIYLEHQYQRDSDAANQAAAAEGGPNGDIFKKAQDICVPRYRNLGSYSLAYQQCVIDELNKYPAGASLTSSLKLPKADSYRHSFIAPLWSPDFAGFSVLLCLLIIIVIIGRLLGLFALKLLLKKHTKGI